MKKVGSVSSVLYQVFGGIGLGITGLVTFIRLIVLSSGETTLAGWIVNLIFLAFFFGMVRLGIGQKRRLRRAIRYVRLCDYKMYCEIEMIAKNTGKEDAYVARDIEKMLDDGFFPEGHLDGQKTCFMLNDVVFRQYLEAENSRRQREGKERTPERTDAQRAQGTEQNVKGQAVPEMSGTQEAEMNTMVSEGMECIRRLRDLNDRISSEDISKRLFRLENLLKDIFDSICEHPEQMHRMHKLMDYYLPTTLKLVEAYAEFDQVSAPGDEITAAKAEIEMLISGECIEKEIIPELTYTDLDSQEAKIRQKYLWSVLFATGYLTDTEKPNGKIHKLAIPNKEVLGIYEDKIRSWFEAKVTGSTEQWKKFCAAIKNGDVENVELLFNEFLSEAISIRDTAVKSEMKENFYHGLLLGLLNIEGSWIAKSNIESGIGYDENNS